MMGSLSLKVFSFSASDSGIALRPVGLSGCARSGLPLAMGYTGDAEVALANRSADWFAQAGRDLDQAKASQAEGRHEWACFAAQQAAEMAVKALHLALGQEAWGHVIARLLVELPLDARHLVDQAKVLDNFYVATRYANGHPEGAPFEHYGPLQSDQAIRYAGEILEFVRVRLA
jgi:HEPN domain-containing protein